MNLRVEESEFVPCDVLEIVRYLQQRNPAAAARFIAAFKRTVSFLAGAPLSGRRRPDLGGEQIRSWRIHGFRNYLVIYQTATDRIRLLRVLHGYRDLQAELEDFPA